MLSKTSQYTVRALAYLYSRGDKGPVLGSQLAKEVHVPAHYLSKIMAELSRHGILQATRGRRGGYLLTKKGGKITLMDIVEPFENIHKQSLCVFDEKKMCGKRTQCKIHKHYVRAKNAYINFLMNTTLADLSETQYG